MQFLELLRVKQYYKNLIIFLALIFLGKETTFEAIILTFIGFIALCLISSTNYIINDILDKDKDKLHPKKSKRPIASNYYSTTFAGIIAIITAIASLSISILISEKFFFLVLLLFFLTLFYSLKLKEEIFLDITLISTNFIIRAISGIIIIEARLSPWLILCTFFLSLLLATGKRIHEFNSSKEHKIVLKYYTKDLLNKLLIISTTLLILSYSLYSFLSIYPILIYTIPISAYIILRYLYLIEINSNIPGELENFYKDKQLLIALILWFIVTIIIIIH
jgi:4-hydroxybenzoate polyprenyltransferase